MSTTELERCFQSGVESVEEAVAGVVSIDGQTRAPLLRHRLRQGGRSSGQRLVLLAGPDLGQGKTEPKSKEINAIPKFLRLLEIKGCIVTLDAMGCQKQMAEQIIDQEGEYVPALKGNQGRLHDEVLDLFQDAIETNFDGLSWDHQETREEDHGRVKIRRYWTMASLDRLSGLSERKEIKSIGMVESERRTGESGEMERRYYISSLDGEAQPFAQAVRRHWGIENSLHWVLDVAFREDECRIREGHAAENLSILRRLALNLLRRETSCKRGIQVKRMKAGWDLDYLMKILNLNTSS